jgi:hypothetical protein
MLKSLVSVLPITFLSHFIIGQNVEIGLTLGLTKYDGDIQVNGRNVISSVRPGIGLVGKYRLADRLVLRGHLIAARLAGSEKNSSVDWQRSRGLAFASNLTELALQLEYDILKKDKFSVFAFAGGGASFFNPRTDYNEPNPFIATDVNLDSKAGFSKITPAVPMGIGIKYPLKNNFNLYLDMGYRKIFTDYLDGVSKIANPKRVDAYFFGGVTLTKEFGKKGDEMVNCPKL